jgi:hypothetical protein
MPHDPPEVVGDILRSAHVCSGEPAKMGVAAKKRQAENAVEQEKPISL